MGAMDPRIDGMRTEVMVPGVGRQRVSALTLFLMPDEGHGCV